MHQGLTVSRQIQNLVAIVLSIGLLATGDLSPAQAAGAPATAGFATAGGQIYDAGVVDVVGQAA